jgi:hypothetical protein
METRRGLMRRARPGCEQEGGEMAGKLETMINARFGGRT